VGAADKQNESVDIRKKSKIMSFNGLGNYYLGPGASWLYWVCRGSSNMTQGQNYGAQIVMADPNNDGTAGTLQASNFQKQINYNEFFANGTGDTNTAYWLYWVTITNVGGTGKWFSLQGGGMT
jgi:hypothetical protein